MTIIDLTVAHPSKLVGEVLCAAFSSTIPERKPVSVRAQCVFNEAGLRHRLQMTPDAIVLLSYQLCGPTSSLLIERVTREFSRTRFVVIEAPASEQTAVECLAAGAKGWMTEKVAVMEILNMTRSVMEGHIICSPRVTFESLSTLSSRCRSQQTPDHLYKSGLTTREMEILYWIGKNLSNKEIADRLCISIYTVKNHVHRILEKLRVTTRLEAVRLAEPVHSKSVKAPSTD